MGIVFTVVFLILSKRKHLWNMMALPTQRKPKPLVPGHGPGLLNMSKNTKPELDSCLTLIDHLKLFSTSPCKPQVGSKERWCRQCPRDNFGTAYGPDLSLQANLIPMVMLVLVKIWPRLWLSFGISITKSFNALRVNKSPTVGGRKPLLWSLIFLVV